MTHAKPRTVSDDVSSMRKRPMQARAQHTLAMIFEATIQLIEEEGEEALTTYRIAKKAGFSIGTLYQYFPTQEAILLALITRERRLLMDTLSERMAHIATVVDDSERTLREHWRILVEVLAGNGQLNRSIVRMIWKLNRHESIVEIIREATEYFSMAIARIDSPTLRKPREAMMFVITHAVMGVLCGVVLRGDKLINIYDLEDEVVRLVLCLIKKGGFKYEVQHGLTRRETPRGVS